jgi:16S rRNA (cytosine967-C5)-methyltransferase
MVNKAKGSLPTRESAPRHQPQLRADAAWALMQILEHGASSREVMPAVFKRHEKAQDRAWLQETVFGVLRVLPTLQSWLRQLLDKPLKKQQKIIEQVIMVGLFQQAFMRTSSHAAVSETVNASKVLKQPQLSGVVNAILRNFERHNLAQQTLNEPHVIANLPKWLYKKLVLLYPEKIDALCAAMQDKPPLWLRVNPLVTSLDDYCQKLDAEGTLYTRHAPYAVKLEKYSDVTLLPMYEEGGFSVQDFAAQQAAILLDVQTDDIVLDACAAPGGKTAAILESYPDVGALYALDNVEKRNDRTLENLNRLGHLARFKNRVHVINADASNEGTYKNLPLFNKILLDAPCSATGVIRRHPDIKWHRKAQDIEVLVELQYQILERAWAQLAPKGTLLYATCSILAQENTEQITRFLDAHPDAEVLPITHENANANGCWQILPGEQNMDGFFYARLLKSA